MITGCRNQEEVMPGKSMNEQGKQIKKMKQHIRRVYLYSAFKAAPIPGAVAFESEIPHTRRTTASIRRLVA